MGGAEEAKDQGNREQARDEDSRELESRSLGMGRHGRIKPANATQSRWSLTIARSAMECGNRAGLAACVDRILHGPLPDFGIWSAPAGAMSDPYRSAHDRQTHRSQPCRV